MPRRSPGALRAQRFRPTSPRPHIRGLSSGTCHAIHVLEQCSRYPYHPSSGFTARALNRYELFLASGNGGTLYPPVEDCYCRGCVLNDVRFARDVLEHVLWKLPKRAHTELSRRLAPLDELYLHRTLPDPFADLSRPWWHQRIPAD